MRGFICGIEIDDNRGFLSLGQVLRVPFRTSGILAVNAHALITILKLNYINSFILYSSMTCTTINTIHAISHADIII